MPASTKEGADSDLLRKPDWYEYYKIFFEVGIFRYGVSQTLPRCAISAFMFDVVKGNGLHYAVSAVTNIRTMNLVCVYWTVWSNHGQSDRYGVTVVIKCSLKDNITILALVVYVLVASSEAFTWLPMIAAYSATTMAMLYDPNIECTTELIRGCFNLCWLRPCVWLAGVSADYRQRQSVTWICWSDSSPVLQLLDVLSVIWYITAVYQCVSCSGNTMSHLESDWYGIYSTGFPMKQSAAVWSLLLNNLLNLAIVIDCWLSVCELRMQSVLSTSELRKPVCCVTTVADYDVVYGGWFRST